MGLIITQHLR